MTQDNQFVLCAVIDERQRGVRDAFERAGFSDTRLTQAMEWYRQRSLPGLDELRLMESFNERAAVSDYG